MLLNSPMDTLFPFNFTICFKMSVLWIRLLIDCRSNLFPKIKFHVTFLGAYIFQEVFYKYKITDFAKEKLSVRKCFYVKHLLKSKFFFWAVFTEVSIINLNLRYLSLKIENSSQKWKKKCECSLTFLSIQTDEKY